jgi:hypothetical protein
VNNEGDAMEEQEKLSERFPLRLTPKMNAEIRALARGGDERPPSGINDMIVQLLAEALQARREKRARLEKSESDRGNWAPAVLVAA